ncbi:MAG TPA: hypothetical protein VGQ28_12000 [Thermoanaerobaculia bacterium]|nr:hypothetical protein [Thermoanaerobaculia bacterium]
MSLRVRLAISPPLLRLAWPGDRRPNRDSWGQEPQKPVIDLDETQPMLVGSPARVSWEQVPVRCIRCNGELAQGVTPVHVERQGVRADWDAVPAWVCRRCEAPYFEPREVDVIRRSVVLMQGAVSPK